MMVQFSPWLPLPSDDDDDSDYESDDDDVALQRSDTAAPSDPVAVEVPEPVEVDATVADDAIVAVRKAPPQLPRFDIRETNCYSAAFLDNFSYPPVEGKPRIYCLVMIDWHSREITAVDVSRKSSNGAAFDQMVSTRQLRNISTPITIYADGDGAMAPIRDRCHHHGFRFV